MDFHTSFGMRSMAKHQDKYIDRETVRLILRTYNRENMGETWERFLHT